jgi:hypothetical protein
MGCGAVDYGVQHNGAECIHLQATEVDAFGHELSNSGNGVRLAFPLLAIKHSTGALPCSADGRKEREKRDYPSFSCGR